MAESGRQLRNVRFEQALRAFERLGYSLDRIKGAHYILKHPGRGIVVLPSHGGELKAGLLLDAVKKAGVSVDQFSELL